MKNLLIELLTEELPPKSLGNLGRAFAHGIYAQLQPFLLEDVQKRLLPVLATPRRLAVLVKNVKNQAEKSSKIVATIPKKIAFDEMSGKISQPLLKRLSGLGIAGEAIENLLLSALPVTFGEASVEIKVYVVSGDKVLIEQVSAGSSLVSALQEILPKVLSGLPIAKMMSYQLSDGWETVNFVRPVQCLTVLYGEEVLPVSVLGVHAGRVTRGHRFLSQQQDIEIDMAENYEAILREQGGVIVDFAKRRQMIADALLKVECEGLTAFVEEKSALLDEVTSLVESPNIFRGEFDESFLQVPQECLVLTMETNQKYFPLFDKATGKLKNVFCIVSNMSVDSASLIIEGNERVVRSRLSDAQFFFEQDKKKTLDEHVKKLANIVYHQSLGSYRDHVERLMRLSDIIFNLLFQNISGFAQIRGLVKIDSLRVARVAELAKADLVTDMVGEFPELQGVMGGHYAIHQGLEQELAEAIEDHYKPRFAQDGLPRNYLGTVVALADRLLNLVGLFASGLRPTGDKDPYALRRQGLGVLRLLMEKQLPLSLLDLLEKTWDLYVLENPYYDIVIGDAFGTIGKRSNEKQKKPLEALFSVENREKVLADLRGFFLDRLEATLREEGVSAQVCASLLSGEAFDTLGRDLITLHAGEGRVSRIMAVEAFMQLPEASALISANKRIANILKKADVVEDEVADSLLQEPAEKNLYQVYLRLEPMVMGANGAGDYVLALQLLAELKVPVDQFFDEVMVNVEDELIRKNRLALLKALYGLMNGVTELAKL